MGVNGDGENRFDCLEDNVFHFGVKCAHNDKDLHWSLGLCAPDIKAGTDTRPVDGLFFHAKKLVSGCFSYPRGHLDRYPTFLKCEGLDDNELKLRPIGSSKLSLHGLVRHMAEVERNWFSRVLASDPSVPSIWFAPSSDDSELEPLDNALWSDDLLAWRAECETSRRLAGARSLDDTGLRGAQPCSLRWIYTHMIEEYARHNGHADPIRELIDGAVGW